MSGHRLRSRHTSVPRNNKAQRQVRGKAYANAARHRHAAGTRAVVTQLQRRRGINQIQPIVRPPRNPQRLAKPPRSARQLSQSPALLICAPPFSSAAAEKGRETAQPPVSRHLFDPLHRLQCAYQHASAMPHAFAGDIHAGVHPINEINISMPRGSKQHLISRRRSTKRMRRRIGRLLVRSQIGLNFDDPPSQPSRTSAPREYLPQQPPRHALRRRLKEAALQQPSRQFALFPPPHSANPFCT